MARRSGQVTDYMSEGARNAGLNKRISALEQAQSAGSSIAVSIPEPDTSLPGSGASFLGIREKKGIRPTLAAFIPGDLYKLKTVLLKASDVASEDDYFANRIVDKTRDISDDQRTAGRFEYTLDEALDYGALYYIIRLIGFDINGNEIANPIDAPLYSGYPGNALHSFTTPEAFNEPSDPDASLILANALDPTTKDYDAYTVFRVYAPLTDAGAAQTFGDALVDRVRAVVGRTGTGIIDYGDVRLDDTQLTQTDPASTPANRGYVDVTVSGLRPGTAYLWVKNVVWTGGEKAFSTGAAVAFTAAGLVIGAAGLPGLTSVSLTPTVDGDIASSTSCSVTLAFAQSYPATALRRLKLFYKKSTTSSYGDDPYTRTLHKDDFHGTTLLNGGINNSVTTITVDDTSLLASVGAFKIDSEIITYTGKTSTTFTGCTRGTNGTSAASHSDNAQIVGFYTVTWTGIKIKPRVDWNFKVTIVGEGDPTGVAPTRDVTATLDATALNDPSAPAAGGIVVNSLNPNTKEHDATVALRIWAPLTDAGAAQTMRQAQVEKAWVQVTRASTGSVRKEGGSLNDTDLTQVDAASPVVANRGFVDIEFEAKVADFYWTANIVEGLGETHTAFASPLTNVPFKAGGLATAGSGITELTSVSLSLNTSDPYDGKNALLTLNFTQPSTPVALRYALIETSTDGGGSFQQVGDPINLKHSIWHTAGAQVVPLRIIKTKRLTSHIFRVTIVAQGGNTRQVTLTSTTPDSSSSTPIPGALAAPTVTTNTVDGDPEKNNARIVVTVAPASGTFSANNITAVYVVVVKRDSTGTPDATDKQTLTKALSTAELATSTCTLEFLEVMGQRLRITKVIAANGDQRTETGSLSIDFTAGGVVTGATGEITVPPPTISSLIIDDSDNKAVVVPVVVTQNGSVITLFKKLVLEKRIPATTGTYRLEKEINLRHEDGLYLTTSSTQTFNISCKRKAGQTVGFRARIKAVGGAVSADSSERTDTASTGDILTDTQIPGGTGATLTAPTCYLEPGKGVVIDFNLTGLTFMNTHTFNTVRVGTLSETIPTRTITNAPNTASPTTITTSAAHGFSVNQPVVISGVGGNTAVNGSWTVLTVPSTTTFTIGVAGSGAYTSGGSVSLPGAFLDIPTKTLVASATTSKKEIGKGAHTTVHISLRKLRDLFGPTAHLAIRYFVNNSIGETSSAITDFDLAAPTDSMSETGLEQGATIPAKTFAFGLVQLLPGAGFLSSFNAYDSAQSVNTVGKDWRDGPGGNRILSTAPNKGLTWLKATHNIEVATNVSSLGGELSCRIPRRQIVAGETYALQLLMKMASGTYTLNAFTMSLYDLTSAVDITGTPVTVTAAIHNKVLTTSYADGVICCVFLVDPTYVQGGGQQWLRLKFGENPPQIMYIDNVSLVNRAQSIPWCPSIEDAGIQVDVTVTGDTGAGGVGSTGGGGNGSGGACFPAGTMIQLPDGLAAIEELQVGDRVTAVTEEGHIIAVPVTATHKTRSEGLSIITDGWELLRTTAEHPLRTGDGKFVPAGLLKIGERVSLLKDGVIADAAIFGMMPTGAKYEVHNLSVGFPHTFIADSFIVHNKINPGEGGGIIY